MKSVFIVATERSEAHLLCRTMCSFEAATDLMGGVEDPKTLEPTALAAISGCPLNERVYSTIATKYREANERGHVYIDQSYPLLWFVESLSMMFPECIFIFPWRPNEQILASMLKDQGVLKWYERLRHGAIAAEYPNRFFGVNCKTDIEALSLDRLCLARIVSHKFECLRLRTLLGESKIRILEHERLAVRGASAITDLLSSEEVIKLGRQAKGCKAELTSLSDYVYELSKAQKELAYSNEVLRP
ncbi:hypothetical protein [Synechococcus sp. CBW1004]|uniref:hypothetical protein n=1 Tax=Synechococcus sp. CBW1004 TaxID=1353136 RepID=UPI0018CEC321|nr:hypothetical protein [Synechococcus sp. CBW1004]QPN63166.1 hypothetical protein H8F25_16450 [Synechococcus sp. CBW1004]